MWAKCTQLWPLKGTKMGPLLVLVCSCFRENVIVTCKILSFLCSLDNLLQNNVTVFFLEIKFQNGVHLKKKKAIFDLLFTFLVTRESYKNSFSTHLTHIHSCILLTLLTFFALPILKKYEFIRYGFSLVGFLVLILFFSRRFGSFGAINK